ncbi:MAG: hypothetical protein HYZ71_00475 [Deltaproteobacteria bacterium]|nr:hypothetical protein [Deltaproteobacteria bacterium]
MKLLINWPIFLLLLALSTAAMARIACPPEVLAAFAKKERGERITRAENKAIRTFTQELAKDAETLVDAFDAETRAYDWEKWVTKKARQVSALSGKPVSVTGTLLRKVRLRMTMFLYIGDTDQLNRDYATAVTEVEGAFLRRERNLEKIVALERANGPQEILDTASDLGLLEDHVANLTPNAMRTAIIKGLKAKNDKFEATIGKYYLTYRQVRKVLNELNRETPDYFINILTQIEDMGAPWEHFDRVSKPKRTPQQTPTDPATSPISTKMVSTEPVEESESESPIVEDVIDALQRLKSGAPGPRGYTKQLLELGLMSSRMAELIANAETPEGKAALDARLGDFIQKLRKAKGMVANTNKLRKTLGLQPHDFVTTPGQFTTTRKFDFDGEWKGSVEKAVERLYYSSKHGLARHNREELWREVLSASDSVVMLGFLSSYVPAFGRLVGGTTEAISKRLNKNPIENQSAQMFVYTLLSGLYNEAVVDQHLPALVLLERSHGDPEQLARITRWLAAGSKGDVLKTFARNAQTEELWDKIKGFARADLIEKARKDLDSTGDPKIDELITKYPYSLLAQMVEAEKFRALGWISEIDGRSRARQLLMTLVWVFGAHQTGVTGWAANTLNPFAWFQGKDDDDDEVAAEIEAILKDVRELQEKLEKMTLDDEEKRELQEIIKRLQDREEKLESKAEKAKKAAY